MIPIEELQELWNKKHLSFTEIADLKNMTRSAVAGQVKRARKIGVFLETRVKYSPRAKAPILRGQRIEGPPVSIFKHQDYQCKEVVGPMTMCSSPRMEGKSYCQKHYIGKGR